MFRSLPLLSLLLATPSLAHDFRAGELTVGHPYAFETTQAGQAPQGYFSVTNAGAVDDRLIAVRPAQGEANLRVAERFRHMVSTSSTDSIAIPAGETVTLRPSGPHVSFTAPEARVWSATERMDAILVFENAGEVPVVFNVEARKAGMGNGHSPN
ncbi:hypothetical protein CG51_09690 [Haematobacter missouriensis]|nr:copper chaperone PCu(A)C [Haematobacter missouriensis]KFI33681.1 hypothetical protein CG51_09690 [Haematobacter missouriensis]